MMGNGIPLGHKASMVMERIVTPLDRTVASFKQSDRGTFVIGGGLQGSADVEGRRSFIIFSELAKCARGG